MDKVSRNFDSVEEAMSETIDCPVYRCRILPWRCSERKERAKRDKWNNGDRSIDMNNCLTCKVGRTHIETSM